MEYPELAGRTGYQVRHRDTGQVLLEWGRGDADAALRSAKLAGADFGAVNFDNRDLRNADLSRARLRYAQLSFAALAGANLSHADLSATTLCETVLTGADLTGADLSASALHHTDFSGANLAGADFTGAELDGTLFINCRALHKARGLSQAEHAGPSVLDVRTLRESVLFLPDDFLLGVGYTQQEIISLRAFYSQAATLK